MYTYNVVIHENPMYKNVSTSQYEQTLSTRNYCVKQNCLSILSFKCNIENYRFKTLQISEIWSFIKSNFNL